MSAVKKICVVSGGFDPIHSGHIDYINSAKLNGDFLVVALNSDEWLIKKKGKFFMPFSERKSVIQNLKAVDKVIDFKDDSKGSCINALKKIKKMFPNEKIIFCNGGDRSNENTLEQDVEGIEFLFGVGGKNKKNSSSWILKDFVHNSEDRIWGKFYNLFSDDKVKVKELIVLPNKGISYQRHNHRSEFWFISKGNCLIKHSDDNPEKYVKTQLKEEDIFHIKKDSWHQLINESDRPCHIIEIQYGSKREEDDIERHSYYEENEK